MTGNNEHDYTGVMFHVGSVFSSDLSDKDFLNAIHEKDVTDESGYVSSDATVSYYIDGIAEIINLIKKVIIFAMIIMVFVLVSAFNTVNVTISNLHLRKYEFAQLRAIGMTKRGVLKAVLLEGGIVWIIC